MRISIILGLVLVLAVSVAAAPRMGPGARDYSPMSRAIDNEKYIDANNILMFVTNHGNFGRDLSGVFGYDYGTFYPFNTIQDILDGRQDFSIIYASGLWVGCVDSATGETRIAIAEYTDEYVPGPMVGGTFQPDNPSFKVYKLYKDSLENNPNEDFLNWPIDQGAPWKLAENGVDSIPDMVGDQMLWAVYNDASITQHVHDAGSTLPLGLEIRQTTFAYDREDPLGNIIFLRFQVYNKGGNTLQDCYISLWADPDLGEYTNDLIGCDTVLSMGFCYNGDNNDQQFGSNPPAVGYDFFQGPLEFTDNPDDTARMWGQLYEGYVNMGMTSFNKYINGTDPDSYIETYNYMSGKNRDGSDYTYNGIPTKYFVAGDPVTGQGDLDFAPEDRRFMLSTGPITFRPGDSTEILAAIVVGRGADRLSSVTVMKYNDKFAQAAYENNFVVAHTPAAPVVTCVTGDEQISIYWTDTSEVDHGDYPFEGYALFMRTDLSADWTKIAYFDEINGVAKILDEVQDPITSALETRLVKEGTDEGIQHHFVVKRDYVTGRKLRNNIKQFFRLEAYSYDESGFPKTLTSATQFDATPEAALAGDRWPYMFDDTLPVEHIAGESDGSVVPVVLDRTLFYGDTFLVVFEEDGEGGYTWDLVNQTLDDIILDDQTNQSGDKNYEITDGFIAIVSGPEPVGKSYSYASASPPNFSPIAVSEIGYPGDDYPNGRRWFTGDDESGGELLFGGVYMEPNFWGATTVALGDMKPVELRFRPMESYTDLNSNSQYDIGEPYEVDEPDSTQKAFVYRTFDPATYLGFYDIPFTAWDVSDPDNPRQVNVVFRDRDQNLQWDLSNAADPPDPLLPNNGDQRYNYLWVLTSDYDATGTMYGDGTGGTIDFWGGDEYVVDAMWTIWLDMRNSADLGLLGMLSEECTLTLVPNVINTPADTFMFVTSTLEKTSEAADLDAINVVPNPFYLYGPYDPSVGNYQIKFQHLPAECKISIFNLAGDRVRLIEKNDPTTSVATWNARNDSGIPVASGIYIYVVDAPGFGVKKGKLAVFVETEVLEKY